MKRHTWIFPAVLVLAALMLFAVNLVSARPVNRYSVEPVWTTVFSDTFATALPVWTVTDETGTGYQWGARPYMHEGMQHHGFWSAGGGDLGGLQQWSTGTYPGGIETVAVAGPFTLARDAVEVRLVARILNASLEEDLFRLSLSRDGDSPIEWNRVGLSASGWQTVTQTVTQTGGAFRAGESVWIFMHFYSDQGGVQGALVDHLAVEARYRQDVFLPMIRLDPTPTPPPLRIFHDDFTDPSSGWFVGWAQRYNSYTNAHGAYISRLEDVAEMLYRNGTYQIQVPLTWHGGGGVVDSWKVWPAEVAPLPASSYPIPDSYCIEVTGRIPKTWALNPGDPLIAPHLAHWGIVFGANESLSEIYTFQVNSQGNLGIIGFHDYRYPGNRNPLVPGNIEWPIYRWPDYEIYGNWSDAQHGGPPDVFKTLRVHVRGGRADFIVNGELLATANIDGMPRDRIGLIGGSYEITPVVIEFDSFRYDPTCTP
jgi:hypothetical protein